MRNPKRIAPFLKKFQKVWKKNPDLRFGQLVSILHLGHKYNNGDIFYLEDEHFEESLDKRLERFKKTL